MMDTPTHQLDTQGSSNWTWPDDDRTPVDITPYIFPAIPKGLKRLDWGSAARW